MYGDWGLFGNFQGLGTQALISERFAHAKEDELQADLASSGLPDEVQALLIEEANSARLHNANPNRACNFKADYRQSDHWKNFQQVSVKAKAAAKRKAKGKGEVTALQLKQYAKQFHEAKLDE